MAITDISISEELKTSAPSIKYSGNEGPKSPQEMEIMMQTSVDDPFYRSGDEDEHSFRMFNKPYKELNADELEEFREEMMRLMNKFSKGPILPSDEDPINPFGPKPQGPVLPDRQMAAYGGIMGMDGRRQYGLGSKFKKFVRKIIPNEVAAVAEKAAPFVAPFNPLAAGLMSGIGGFDRTGSIGSSIKSGLMNYGLGQGARFLGGGADNLQKGFGLKINPGGEGIRQYFSSPYVQGDDIFSKTKERFFPGGDEITKSTEVLSDNKFSKAAEGTLSDPLEKMDFIDKTKSNNLNLLDKLLDKKLIAGLAAGTLGATALMGNMEPDEIQDMRRGPGLDIEGIRAEVIEAYKDPSGEKLKALRSKYPFLGKRESKDLSQFAMGGRIGRAEGGLMDLGGMEKDYRAEGGFVPIGKAEKADDVPARLSVNEFVFTADAVRNAGGGDIDKGAEVMENMMKNLEAGGQVSEESQGMAGAQQMFETSERLSEVI